MTRQPTICIISNSHSTNDVRLYHKLAKSLCKIATVYVLGAKGVGSMMESYVEEKISPEEETGVVKPTRIIVSGLTAHLRLFSLYRQAKKLKPDLVICVEPLTMLVGLRLKRKIGCQLCYDVHEYYTSAHGERYSFPFNYLIGGLYYVFEHTLQEKMDLTIAVNDDIYRIFNLKSLTEIKQEKAAGKSFVNKILTPPSHLGLVLPNFPSSSIWKDDLKSCGSSGLLPKINFDMIYLGGLTEERGIIKLLQVIKILRQKRSQIRALFVGHFYSEAFKNKFFTYVMDNNLNPNIYWRDTVPHDKVCAVLKQVKIGLSVLHPAYKRYKKALPLKVLEYLSVGLPVVANDFPQIREIVEKHNLGYCVPFHSKDIAEAVEKLLLMSSEEKAAMTQRCRDTIQKHFMWTTVEPALLDAVNYVLHPEV
ncbi:MAG: glycosyltransferase [Candidatus Cloacimonadaceae bacterium]